MCGVFIVCTGGYVECACAHNVQPSHTYTHTYTHTHTHYHQDDLQAISCERDVFKWKLGKASTPSSAKSGGSSSSGSGSGGAHSPVYVIPLPSSSPHGFDRAMLLREKVVQLAESSCWLVGLVKPEWLSARIHVASFDLLRRIVRLLAGPSLVWAAVNRLRNGNGDYANDKRLLGVLEHICLAVRVCVEGVETALLCLQVLYRRAKTSPATSKLLRQCVRWATYARLAQSAVSAVVVWMKKKPRRHGKAESLLDLVADAAALPGAGVHGALISYTASALAAVPAIATAFRP
jgi:hypothetical protein